MVFTDIQELPTVRQAKTEFIQRIKELTGLDTDVEIVPVKVEDAGTAMVALRQFVSKAWNIPWRCIESGNRESKSMNIIDARHSYCYLARTLLRLTDTEIGEGINRHRTTVINSVNNVIRSFSLPDDRSKFLSAKTEFVMQKMEEYMKKKS